MITLVRTDRFTQAVVLLLVYFFVSPLHAQVKERDLRKAADAEGVYYSELLCAPIAG